MTSYVKKNSPPFRLWKHPRFNPLGTFILKLNQPSPYQKSFCCGLGVLFALSILFPNHLSAHGIQEIRYSPPIPGWLFLIAGGLIVALSFLLVNLRTFKWEKESGYSRILISKKTGITIVGYLLSLAGILLAGLVLATRFLGNPWSEDSLASVLIWTGWWMGLTWITLIVGNAWPSLDPWNTLRRIFGKGLGLSFSVRLGYPKFLGAWPAVFALTAFIWFELGWLQAGEPQAIINVFLTFTAWLWIGMAIFEPDIWWKNANPFSRFFEVLGRFAPIEKRKENLEIRMPGSALHESKLSHPSESIFVILVLFAVTFDGFVATPEWWVLLRKMMLQSFKILPKGVAFHVSFLIAILVGMGIFSVFYWLVCRWMARLTNWKWKPWELAGNFTMTLVPIAAAYHIAHFIPAIPSRTTQMVRAASDPFAYGWNLFGWHNFEWTTAWTPETAGIIWIIQTGLIVLGHIASIISAHWRAINLFEDRKSATRVELPMALLMIAYTAVSLWIISRPVLNEPLVPLPGLTPT